MTILYILYDENNEIIVERSTGRILCFKTINAAMKEAKEYNSEVTIKFILLEDASIIDTLEVSPLWLNFMIEYYLLGIVWLL